MPSSDDTLERELVRLVHQLTDEVTRLRQDVTRATAPLFPRILQIERAQEQDRKEREARQAVLDTRLNTQDAELRAQSDILTTINRRGGWRWIIELVILGGMALVIGILLYVFR